MIDKTACIHPSSIVEDGAIIGANVRIGPFVILVLTLKSAKALSSNRTLLLMATPKLAVTM